MTMLYRAVRSPGTLCLALCRRGVKVRPSPWRSFGTQASPVECSSSSYETLAQPTTMTVEVKKSKFIVTAWPVDNAPQAMQLIQDASEPSASHNCWAYQVAQEFRSSDDGEPSGTAGKPILGAIQGEGLDYTAVLVTRYFGGVKLGAGGLVRAYGGAARDCLRAAPKEVQVPKVPLVLSMTYNEMGSLYGQLDRLNAIRAKEEEYLDNGLVRVEVAVAIDCERDFIEAVSNITAGQLSPNDVVVCNNDAASLCCSTIRGPVFCPVPPTSFLASLPPAQSHAFSMCMLMLTNTEDIFQWSHIQ